MLLLLNIVRIFIRRTSQISLLLAGLAGCGFPAPTPNNPILLYPVLVTGTAFRTSPIDVTIRWNEIVTDFDGTEVRVTNGTLANFSGSGTDYSFEITPDTEGDITLTFPAGSASAQDTANIPADLVVRYDITGPTISISRLDNEGTGTLPARFTATFDEEINPLTFTAPDVQQNGSASGVTWTVSDNGDHTNFTISATAVSGNWGTLAPKVVASLVKDIAGNDNALSTAADNGITYIGSIYNDLALWFKADSLLIANGLPVTEWIDIGPAENDATETTDPPTLVGGAQNGLPAVRFTGNSEILRTSQNTGITGNPDMTVVFVVRVNGFGGNFPAFLQLGETAGTGLSTWIGLDGFSDLFFTGFYNGGIKSNASVNPGFNIYTWIRNSGASANSTQTGNTQYWNGVAVGTASSLVDAPVALIDGIARIGQGVAHPSLDGDIAEILVFHDNALSNPNRTALELYLNTKWNLY